MSKKEIRLLCTEEDRAALRPVLDALGARGFRVAEGKPARKEDVVLAALSESFCADGGKTQALLDLLAAGAEKVLPLQLDGARLPEELKDALRTRNIIPAAGRDAAQIAERIVAAPPPGKPKLPRILTAAALALIAVVGLLVWRLSQTDETEEAVPVIVQEDIYFPEGVTPEDLAKILDVVIVGEQMELYTREDFENVWESADWDYFAYCDWEDDGPHWYSREDGHEYTLTRYEDLRFLGLLPNLRSLSLALVDAGQLPELAGLEKLNHLMLLDSVIPDLEWVRGSGFDNGSINNTTGSITDFSPLTSCERLRLIHLDLDGNRTVDLSSFAPPALEILQIDNGHDLLAPDLSALSACAKLRECGLNDLPLTDLSFLSGMDSLQILRVENMDALRDISAIGNLKKLNDLYIGYSPRITDYTPIAGCTALESIHVQGDDNPDALRDASFLRDLPKLRDIGLYSCNLNNLDFLEGIAAHQSSIALGFAGDILDYSGLAHIKQFENLHVNPRYQQGSRGGDFSAVLPHIQDAEIDSLMLYSCAGVDLSELPDGIRELSICYGDLRDLSGLKPYSLGRLELRGCRYLGSLNGIEAIPTLSGSAGQMGLSVTNCPRLTDWSALEGANLPYLEITGGYSLPEGVDFHASTLRLDSVADVSDLSFLDSLDTERSRSFVLVGLDGLNNLQPLRHFHGVYLAVSPQLAEQAEDLVKDGLFNEYRIEYPAGGWEQDDSELALLSLEELDTLPPALLRRVARVCIAGDRVIDPDAYDICEDWENCDKNGKPALLLRDRVTDEKTPLSPGVIEDLERLSALTGLRELQLWGQPIHSLDGIQALSSLEWFSAQGCAGLTDASALFALSELRGLDLKFTSVDSIRGVQNLRELDWLDISHTRVDDLTPLADCDLSAAYERGGLSFHLNELTLDAEDLAALGTVRHFRELYFSGADPALWMSALADSEIEDLGAGGDLKSNEDLAALAADHPELRILYIGWMEELTDLTPLLALENLERVTVHRDMTKAIASLDGRDYVFHLEIQD